MRTVPTSVSNTGIFFSLLVGTGASNINLSFHSSRFAPAPTFQIHSSEVGTGALALMHKYSAALRAFCASTFREELDVLLRKWHDKGKSCPAAGRFESHAVSV